MTYPLSNFILCWRKRKKNQFNSFSLITIRFSFASHFFQLISHLCGWKWFPSSSPSLSSIRSQPSTSDLSQVQLQVSIGEGRGTCGKGGWGLLLLASSFSGRPSCHCHGNNVRRLWRLETEPEPQMEHSSNLAPISRFPRHLFMLTDNYVSRDRTRFTLCLYMFIVNNTAMYTSLYFKRLAHIVHINPTVSTFKMYKIIISQSYKNLNIHFIVL